MTPPLVFLFDLAQVYAAGITGNSSTSGLPPKPSSETRNPVRWPKILQRMRFILDQISTASRF
jgi:hypothetical protein